jgi:hypothetical protein
MVTLPYSINTWIVLTSARFFQLTLKYLSFNYELDVAVAAGTVAVSDTGEVEGGTTVAESVFEGVVDCV